MLRIGILTTVASLAVAGSFWVEQLAAPAMPCLTAGFTNVQLANSAQQPARGVSFTAVKADATILVQIVETPDLADLAIADDTLVATTSCPVDDITRLVAISRTPLRGEPVIHLTRDDDADLRIYVASKTVTLQQAAALIVGVRGGHTHMTTASVAATHAPK